MLPSFSSHVYVLQSYVSKVKGGHTFLLISKRRIDGGEQMKRINVKIALVKMGFDPSVTSGITIVWIT